MFEQSCHRFLLPALLASVLAFTASATAGPQNLTLSCAGPFARDSSEARLKRHFGAHNVSWKAINIEAGEMEEETLLFANDPQRQVIVYWKDRARRHGIARIEIRDLSDRPLAANQSIWRLANGIGVGTPLASVEAINRKPFTISGFGWDLGGRDGGWNGGALETAFGACQLRLSFTQNPYRSSEVSGDHQFWSGDPRVRQLRLVVDTIGFDY